MSKALNTVLAAAVFLLGQGCEDDTGPTGPVDARPDAGPFPDGGPDSRDASPSDASAESPPSLYLRLGSEAGIRVVVTDFVGRVLNDTKLNGYFLNSSVNGTRLVDCLVLQLSSLAGGGQQYPGTSMCRDMRTIHAGMKISMQDFNDTAGHLVAALTAGGVAMADVNLVVAAVTPTVPDIVEDTTNNGTVYQRVGRKPAINTVIDMFTARVVADARINGFFSSANAARLKTCLVRQVCNIDGPCKYGQEVTHPSEPGVGPTTACKDMKSLHAGLTAPPGGGAGRAIVKADFDALVEDLVAVLDGAGVTAGDKGAILAALGPQCDDIVAGGTGCAGRKVTALTSTNTLVTFDSKTPATVSAAVPVTGLQAGESLHGITFRPKNGQLIGLGSTSRLYVINATTGAATVIGTAAFTPALAGAIFGVDFNPTVDRIRVVSDTGQNLRLHPDTGAVAGMDTTINPASAAISAVAYTNSSGSAPKVTTLYNIDVTGNKLVRQGGPDGTPSPNTGTLMDVGALGVDPVGVAGLDIVYLGASNYAYAVMNVGGTTSLYSVSLTSGAATAIAAVGGAVAVKAIAIQP